MSQAETTSGPRILRPIVRPVTSLLRRAEPQVKSFEWSWTTAVIAAVGLIGFLLVSAIILPSAWMYFAESKLGWKGPTDIEALLQDPLGPELRLQIRDLLAMGLTTGPIITLLVAAAMMQNWRKKLRGGDATRPTGGYR
jgi:hypothetical protein